MFFSGAKKEENGYYIDVSPTLISKNDMVANVTGAYNVVEFTCDYVENVLFYGKVVDIMLTASAIAADIMKIRQNSFWQ